jgi:hypothetical protein
MTGTSRLSAPNLFAPNLFAPSGHDGRAFEHRPFVVAGADHGEAIGAGACPGRAEAILGQFPGPSPLAPPPAGTRVILPSGVKVILNLTLELVAAVNGWPLKKVAWTSFGASFVAGGAANAGPTRINAAALPKTPAVRACIAPPKLPIRIICQRACR